MTPSDEPTVYWVQPDPTVAAFFRMTFLGVALLWASGFVFGFQAFGDCPTTPDEAWEACQATSMELSRRAALSFAIALATTALAAVAITRPRGRLPAVLAIAGVAGIGVTARSAFTQSVSISFGTDLALLLPVIGAALVALGAARHVAAVRTQH
jgi:hypothetical protein